MYHESKMINEQNEEKIQISDQKYINANKKI